MTTSINSKDRLIFALDVPDKKEAQRLVKLLHDSVGCFKVGLQLFVQEGPDILKLIKDHSTADIFLDLKLHDIPATVRGALKSAEKLGVRYITIHSMEGEAILEASKELKDSNLEVLAVTLLTSMGEEQLHALGFEQDTKILTHVLASLDGILYEKDDMVRHIYDMKRQPGQQNRDVIQKLSQFIHTENKDCLLYTSDAADE